MSTTQAVPVQRPGTWARLIFLAALCGLVAAWLAHPVCVPLSAADIEGFRRWQPLEARLDRQFHGRVFQQRGGHWFQCKSWISRQMFF